MCQLAEDCCHLAWLGLEGLRGPELEGLESGPAEAAERGLQNATWQWLPYRPWQKAVRGRGPELEPDCEHLTSSLPLLEVHFLVHWPCLAAWVQQQELLCRLLPRLEACSRLPGHLA